MKVLLCKGRFAGPISGSDETLVAYATHLKAAGHDVAVVLLYPHGADDPYYARLRRAQVPVASIAQHSLLGRMMQLLKKRVPHLPEGPRKALQRAAYGASMNYVQRCRRYFARAAPAIVHVMTPDPAVMAMVRGAHAARIPVLYQELGTADYLAELTFYYEQLRDVLPLCTRVAALSPALARRFGQVFAAGTPPLVLPLMVDDVPVTDEPRRSPRRMAFGFAARMEYGKGVLPLLDAFGRVRRRVADVSLRLAGHGPQQAQAEAHAAAAGFGDDCAFAGAYIGPAAKQAFMDSIDVFMLPSLAEGTPNCVIEAMAHGLPVIATAVGGIPDVVSPETAILVPPGDVATLAEAMTALASDPERRAAMGRAGRKRYESLFSPAVVLPLLLDRYREVAGGRANGAASHPWA